MLEALLAAGGGGIFFPNSGPGSKYVENGNLSLGFFEVVPKEELFTNAQLLNELNYWDGEMLPDDGWLKFIMDNKVYFTPKKEIVKTTSWEELYNNGLVYGTTEIGKYPVGTGVSQERLVNKDGHWFRVRLFRSSGTDPVVTGSGSYPEELRTGEWYRFICPLMKSPPAGYAGPSWKLFDNSELTHSMYGFTQETYSANVNNAIVVGQSGLVTMTNLAKTTKHPGYGWRPLLELIDNLDAYTFAVDSVNYNTDYLTEVGGVEYDASGSLGEEDTSLYAIRQASYDAEMLSQGYFTEVTIDNQAYTPTPVYTSDALMPLGALDFTVA